MKSKYFIGIAVIVFGLLFGLMNLEKSFTPYVSVAEAAQTDATVQIKGTRVPDSEFYDAESGTFQFKMSDDDGNQFQVMYAQPKPSNFERAAEVVAIGRFDEGAFHAEKLLIKCPSKYEAEAPEHMPEATS